MSTLPAFTVATALRPLSPQKREKQVFPVATLERSVFFDMSQYVSLEISPTKIYQDEQKSRNLDYTFLPTLEG